MKIEYNKLKIGDIILEIFQGYSQAIEVDSLVLHYLEKWKDDEQRLNSKYSYLKLEDYHLDNCREFYRVDEKTFSSLPLCLIRLGERGNNLGFSLTSHGNTVCHINFIHELQHLYTSIMKYHLEFKIY